MKNRQEIDEKTFKKVEGMLYKYFKQKKEIRDIQDKIKFLQKEIENIEQRLRNTDVTIIDFYKQSNIGEKVQTSSSGCGFAEQQIINVIEKLENKQKEMHVKILKLTFKEKNIEEFIYTMEKNIELLGEKEKKFIKLKYKDNLSTLQISKIMKDEFFLGQASFYTNVRKSIVENIAHWMNLIKN